MKTSETNFQYAYIDDATKLPRNIALVHAPSIDIALIEMFNVVAKDPYANFIVWNPPAPVLNPAEYEELKNLRINHPFGGVIEAKISPQSAADLQIKRCKLYTQTLEGVTQEHGPIPNRLTQIFRSRFMDYALAASAVTQNQVLNFDSVECMIFARALSYALVTHKYELFHVDSSRNEFLRMLHSPIGPASFVIGADDVEYLDDAPTVGGVHATLTNPNATVYMMHSGSYGLMRSGGTSKTLNAPAMHDSPHVCAHVPEGTVRMLERCDFSFA